VLSRVFAYAVREGLVPLDPVRGLERGERPSVGTTRAKRVLSNDEIVNLIEATPVRYRPLVVTAIFTGLRVGELLGLTWADVDLDRGFIHVRKQLDRQGNRVDPKTEAAVRDIVLLAALAQALREHKRASRHTGDGDFVFATRKGTPEHWRNCVTRGIDKATNTTKMNADPSRPKVTMHTLRHSFASHLIVDLKLDVVRVSRMLGHTRPSITEDIYAHEFEQARHAEDVRAAMEASAFGKLLERAASVEVRREGALDPLARESDGR
jgi:integrase